MVKARALHIDSRQPQILDAAARLFCTQGFASTSVRDISRAVGILPGSLYCHFATKEDLLTAVYVKGVAQISTAVQQAVQQENQPWARLQAACRAHLEAILHDDDYAQVVIRVRPNDLTSASPSLVELRDSYEKLFADLIGALPLRSHTDQRALRLFLLGALNWAQTWYRPEGALTPQMLAENFVALLRQSQELTL